MLQFSIITISTVVTLLDSITIFFGNKTLKKDITKYIPICSIVYGILLGIAGYFVPSVDMGTSIVEAIFIGLSAGAAATGVNQVGKQLTKEESLEYVFKILNDYLNSINSSCDFSEDNISDVPECDVESDDTCDVSDEIEETTEGPIDES